LNPPGKSLRGFCWAHLLEVGRFTVYLRPIPSGLK
jgi:hypothetical protein